MIMVNTGFILFIGLFVFIPFFVFLFLNKTHFISTHNKIIITK